MKHRKRTRSRRKVKGGKKLSRKRTHSRKIRSRRKVKGGSRSGRKLSRRKMKGGANDMVELLEMERRRLDNMKETLKQMQKDMEAEIITNAQQLEKIQKWERHEAIAAQLPGRSAEE